MRPISLEFQCFGPYMEKQRIDFEMLSKDGLFLICGETGAGKTTVLDAICYALYGKSSGGERGGEKGDMSVMRCKSAGDRDVTYVDYVFECNGNRYRFYRELKHGRTQLNEYNCCEEIVGEEHVPLITNTKKTAMNDMGEKIIGLTYDQFSRVVILPQGKFERLLTSDSKNKEEILTSIFNADKWDTIVRFIRESANEEKKRLDMIKNNADVELGTFGCKNIDDLAEKKEQLTHELKALEESVALCEEEKKKAADAHIKAVKDNEVFAALAESKKAYERLLRMSPVYDEKRETLRLAESADGISAEYAEYSAAAKAAKEAELEKENARIKAAAAEKKHKDASAAFEEHSGKKPEYDANKQRLTIMKNAEPAYKEMGDKEKAAADAEAALSKLAAAAQAAKDGFEKADADYEKANKEFARASDEFMELTGLYAKNSAGALAKDLKDGVPCPVCGSTAHPMPAVLDPSVKEVTDKDIENASKAHDRAKKALEDAASARRRKDEEKTGAQEKLSSAHELAADAKAKLEAAKGTLIPDIPDISALEKEMQSLGRRIDEYESKEQTLNKLLEAAAADNSGAAQHFKDAVSDAENKNSALSEKTEKWKKALADAGFASEEIFRSSLIAKDELLKIRKDVSDYTAELGSAKADFEKKETAAAGMKAPELDVLKQKHDAAELAFKQASGELTLKQSELDKTAKAYDRLSAVIKDYYEKITVADSNLGFARKLDPLSGMSLKKYVLAVMLSQITGAANQLLKNVRGGRFQLRRSDRSASGSRQVGLELNVSDGISGEQRSVTTLSGGEKFLVSLCLAIGLSTVVQSQSGGIKLEAMFIDEGFGSLDSECIDDALGILSGVRKAHSVVGIISHIDKLMENIPTRLEAVRKPDGSSNMKMML